MSPPLHILLVEDTRSDATLLRELLRESGVAFELKHARRLREAVDVVSAEDDVILLDLSLPDAQGLETVREMRSAAPRTALIVLTGRNDEVSALEALREGVEDYCVKGQIDGPLLVRAMRYSMERRRAGNALMDAERERQQLLDNERIARAEAERANQLKDEFLAAISHELRTPLNAILGWAQLLALRGYDDPRRMRDALETIARNATVQARIVNDLLDMSYIVSGKLRLEVQLVSVASAIEAAIATTRPAAEAKNIHVVAHLDRAAGVIRGDPERLQQIAWNLLSNAVKFTPPGGRVEVRVQETSSEVEVVISDTGEGIPQDFLPRVFDRFRQADGSITRRHGGLGLGLSIVRHLVDLHGGTIKVDSPGMGRGATFTVTLPRAIVRGTDIAAPATVDAIRTLSPNVLANLTVLVVDDDGDALSLAVRVLREYGAKVVTAGSPGEAIEQIRRCRPDVLLSDIAMSPTDGYQLIRRVRQLASEHGGGVPAAAVTAYARAEDRARALLAGFQTLVSKPVDPIELVAVVAALAGRNAGQIDVQS